MLNTRRRSLYCWLIARAHLTLLHQRRKTLTQLRRTRLHGGNIPTSVEETKKRTRFGSPPGATSLPAGSAAMRNRQLAEQMPAPVAFLQSGFPVAEPEARDIYTAAAPSERLEVISDPLRNGKGEDQFRSRHKHLRH